MIKLLLSFLLSVTVLAGAGTFPQGDHVKNLKDKIEFKNSKTQIISNDSDDPSAVAKSADAGSLYLRTNGELWQKLDGGSTTNWVQLFIAPLFTSANKLIKSDGLTSILDTGIDVIGTDALGNIDYLGMDIAVGAPAYAEGLLFYDDVASALSYYNDDSDVTVNLGQENIIRVRNVTGADIDDGTPVFVSGSTGQTPNASLADSSFIETSITLGLWTSGTTSNNGFGYVTTFGDVNDLDTSSYAEGDVLYLDTTAGQLVISPPRPPARINILGIVTNSHATQGKIFVRPESITRDVALYKNLITNFAGDAQFNPALLNFTSGDSAIFGDSGTLTGTLATSILVADQLLGTRVFKYTQSAGSLNDWMAFPQATVPELVNTTDVLLAYNFRYKYDGDDGDFEVRARCVDDNSIILDNSSSLDPTKYRFFGEVTVPKDCNEIIIGPHVLVENAGAILLYDDIKISDEPREIKAFTKTHSIALAGNDGRTISLNTEDIPFDGTAVGWTSNLNDLPQFYTPQYADSIITFSGAVLMAPSVDTRIEMFVDNVFHKTLSRTMDENTVHFSYTSVAGEFNGVGRISFRTPTTFILQNNPSYHYLTIVETANTEGTVFDRGNKAEFETQTNTLVTDITSTTADVAELRFTGLEIGALYEVKLSVHSLLVTLAASKATLTAVHDGVNLVRIANQRVSGTQTQDMTHGNSKVFTATATTLTFDASITSAQIDADSDNTFVQLIKLPNPEIEKFIIENAGTKHVTGGIEYKTVDTWNGKPIYSRSFDTSVATVSGSTFTLTTTVSGMIPVPDGLEGMALSTGNIWFDIGSSANGSSPNIGQFSYNDSSGVIATRMDGFTTSRQIFTFRYTKP